MRVPQKQTRPTLLQSVIEAFAQPDLRRKLLFTLGILVIFRFVAHVPVPGVIPEKLQEIFQTNQLLGMLDLFSGGALQNLSVAAMGVYPYITSSIVMQLMTPVIPRLQALAREGEAGRNKLNTYTYWLTVPMCLLQAYGQLVLFQRSGAISGIGLSGGVLLPTLAMVLSMAGGTMFLVWLGDRITENGIGNGISIIIFGGIIATLPTNLAQRYVTIGIWGVLTLVILLLAVTLLIVFVTEAHRRIPVQYSRSLFRGGRMYRQTGTQHIPLRVNSAGMIPLIFAMSLMILPGTIASYFVGGEVSWVSSAANFVTGLFSPNGWPAGIGLFYWGFYFLLVVGFTFFYTIVVFLQQNLGETLQKQGGFIPGIRPGHATSEYLNKVVNRITWGGALFLGFVALMPLFSRLVINAPGAVMILGSMGLLIVVGVLLDTMRQLEAQLLMRRYEGFIK